MGQRHHKLPHPFAQNEAKAYNCCGMLKIVNAPNPVLSAKAKPVTKVNASIKALLAEMEDTLDHAKDPEGVGLAAPQVAKSLQIFIVRQDKNAPLLTFINPVIIEPLQDAKLTATDKKNNKKSVKLEGCLSLQDIWGTVKRHPSVVLEFMDENGKKHKKKFTGFLATIIQHEVDHLNGILFPKHVLEQKGELYKSSKNKKGETVFEEISI
jgi:peptide deformylase